MRYFKGVKALTGADKNELYLYFHIPFCYKKCPYCGFYSLEKSFGLIDDYVEALKREISLSDCSGVVKSIYFGGGTPTVLKPSHIEDVLSAVHKKFSCDIKEATIEAVPFIKKGYLKELVGFGFNRLSLGVQSFDIKKLKKLGRWHSVEDNYKAVDEAVRSGFENISLDLMYGVSEGVDLFKKELKEAVNLDINHISIYLLTIDEHTEFYRLFENGKLVISDDDEAWLMYNEACNFLEANGFLQYEISNFAKKGFRSIHNCAYWEFKNYLGFGASASSFCNKQRFKNKEDVLNYMKDPLSCRVVEENLKDDELLKEAFVFGLRKTDGVSIKEFEDRFGVDLLDYYKDQLNYFKTAGMIEIKGGRIFLSSNSAKFVSNYILSDFL
ncbi:radical SAM family heme chaperone HemW [Hippea jasoniae]|uniref:radical SAM family heme chaperone HemW n=1 Tax=Hippea jasoniae TaxID=944479 RepID=UPI000A0171D3|nr:radical SAM family heme chaperone HemW [Hippea jasoniae]